MIFLSLKKIGQSCGASRWRVCYQKGLPRLVFIVEMAQFIHDKPDGLAWHCLNFENNNAISNHVIFLFTPGGII